MENELQREDSTLVLNPIIFPGLLDEINYMILKKQGFYNAFNVWSPTFHSITQNIPFS